MLVLIKYGPSVVWGGMIGNDIQSGAGIDVVRHTQQSLGILLLMSTEFVQNL